MDNLEPMAGWESPIFHAMQRMPLLFGAPLEVTMFVFLGSLFLVLVAWQWALFGVLLFMIARIGTAYEPCWLGILLDWQGYASEYEG